jgi:hypothetical protein
VGFNTEMYSDASYVTSKRIEEWKNKNLTQRVDDITVNAKGGKQSYIGVRFDLIPPSAIQRVAETLHRGAEKYGETNWHNISTNEHVNHALRHVFVSLETGHASDEDLVHAATRLLMAIDRRHNGE